MKLVICRHGDPDYSIDSLTEKGWKEAELLSDRISKLDVKDFYVSPLGRARDTSKATLKKMNREATVLPWLQEFKGQIMENGEPRQCWDRKPAYWTEIDDYYKADSWYNVDIMKELDVKKEYEEVCKGVDELLLKYGYKHEGRHFKVLNANHDTVVLFCHFGIEAIILSHIFGISPMPLLHNFVALPTSVTTIVTEEREEGVAVFRCMGFGDVSHLYCANEEPAFAARFCECFTDDTRHD